MVSNTLIHIGNYNTILYNQFKLIFYLLNLLKNKNSRLIDSIEQIKLVLNEKDEEFSQRKIKIFCNLLRETKIGQEALINESHKTVTEIITKFLET